MDEGSQIEDSDQTETVENVNAATTAGAVVASCAPKEKRTPGEGEEAPVTKAEVIPSFAIKTIDYVS